MPTPGTGPETDRGVAVVEARGGGGVARGVSGASAPAALLTHRLSAASYTNEFCSPSLARMGLLEGGSAGLPGASAGFAPPPPPPPNQPKPHPRLAGCALAFSSTWRLAVGRRRR
jgi:hypothetical protein